MRRFIVGFLATVGALTILVVVLAGVGIYFLARHFPGEPAQGDNILLTLDLRQSIAEAPSLSPFGLLEDEKVLTMSEIVLGLDAAASDPAVKGLFVRLGEASQGFAKAQELRAAFARFRFSGKPAIGWADSLGEAGSGGEAYMIATALGEVHLQPGGMIGLTGLGIEMPFFRPLLDKIGIEPVVNRRSDYKTMADSASFAGLTPANREMLDDLLDSFDGQLVGAIAEGRRLDEAAVRRLIDQGPFGSDEALAGGLVDALDYLPEAEAALRAQLGGAEPLPLGAYEPPATKAQADGPAVAILRSEGFVVRGEDGLGENVAADTLAQAIRDAVDDDAIQAILLRLDTGGGSAVASETIAREIREAITSGKPVVVSMGNAAASGGYWIAMGASRIVAQPGTYTGSIGVIFIKPMLAALSQQLGINWERLERGANADLWAISKPYDSAGQARVDALLDDIYGRFKDGVARGRGLDPARVEEIAQGRVWTGERALGLGLVDRLGGLREAVEEANVALGRAPEAPLTLRYYPEPEGPFALVMRTLEQGMSAARLGTRLAQSWLSLLVTQAGTARMPDMRVR